MSLPSPRSDTPAPLSGYCLSQRGLSSTGLPGKVAPAPARGAQERPRRVHARPALGSLPWHDALEMMMWTVDCGLWTVDCGLSEKFTLCDTTHKVLFFKMLCAKITKHTSKLSENFTSHSMLIIFCFLMHYMEYEPLTRLECQDFLQPAHIFIGI